MPGPGHFNPQESLFHNYRSAKFGSSKRYDVAGGRGDGPGPGNYTYHDRNIGTAPSYSMAGRYSFDKMNQMPGPG